MKPRPRSVPQVRGHVRAAEPKRPAHRELLKWLIRARARGRAVRGGHPAAIVVDEAEAPPPRARLQART